MRVHVSVEGAAGVYRKIRWPMGQVPALEFSGAPPPYSVLYGHMDYRAFSPPICGRPRTTADRLVRRRPRIALLQLCYRVACRRFRLLRLGAEALHLGTCIGAPQSSMSCNVAATGGVTGVLGATKCARRGQGIPQDWNIAGRAEG